LTKNSFFGWEYQTTWIKTSFFEWKYRNDRFCVSSQIHHRDVEGVFRDAKMEDEEVWDRIWTRAERPFASRN
jgi:hypothetical protein